MRVLGIDPGLTRCGVGVVEGEVGRPLTLVEVGVIRTPSTQSVPERLVAIERGIEQWLENLPLWIERLQRCLRLPECLRGDGRDGLADVARLFGENVQLAGREDRAHAARRTGGGKLGNSTLYQDAKLKQVAHFLQAHFRHKVTVPGNDFQEMLVVQAVAGLPERGAPDPVSLHDVFFGKEDAFFDFSAHNPFLDAGVSLLGKRVLGGQPFDASAHDSFWREVGDRVSWYPANIS